ncbi:c-type cytochrome [bacterium]|nr:MAG: c-type cytochrome [bacterium]
MPSIRGASTRTGRSTVLKSISVLAVALAGALAAGTATAQTYGFGQPATPAAIAGWNIDVNGLSGAGLPAGRGTVAEGQKVYEERCASCHGVFGEGAGRYPVLAGGQGTLTADRSVQTVGSYWPYAPTLFDYVRRAMPFPAPQTLSDDQVYAVVAFILNLNNIVPANAVMDAKTLAAVKMPNRDGFLTSTWTHDTRPDLHSTACMKNCKSGPVQVISDLVSLHVTPEQTESGNVGSQVEFKEAPAGPATAARPAVPSVTFAQVQKIIAQRCAVCHAQKPTQPGFSAAPMGVMLDTPQRIKAAAKKIGEQAVESQAMPIGNVTNMTQAERKLLGAWIAGGAK